MSLRERLFPADPANPHVLMKTEFVGSWESQFLGLGRLTRFIADQLSRFSAADDDLGLGVVFLQRHHAEVGLKLLLERVGAGLETGHRLSGLIEACDEAFTDRGWKAEWDQFIKEQSEYLDVLEEVDPSGFAYRYPVDTKERPISRPPLIDLRALAASGAHFERSVMRTVDVLARAELLMVAEDDLEPTVQDFAAAVRALRSALAFATAMKLAVSDHARQLGLPTLDPTPGIEAARAKADAHIALLGSQEVPLLRVVDLLVARLAADTPELDLEPADIPPRPDVRRATDIRESVLALEKWIATGVGETTRELKSALRAAHARSEGWSGPAGRQLRSDLARLVSRF